MTVADLYPPIAAASFVFCLWFAVIWRFHKTEAPGQESAFYCLWLLLLPASLAAFFWFHGLREPLTTPFHIFMGAIAGIAVGAIGVTLVSLGFLNRNADRKSAWIGRVYLAGFLLLAFGGFVIGSA